MPSLVRAYQSSEFWRALERFELSRIDAVFASSLCMAPYAAAIKARKPGLRAVIDLPDVLSIVAARRLRVANPRWISRWRWKLTVEWLKTRAYEKSILPLFDRIWTCSNTDRDMIASPVLRDRVRVLSNAIDVKAYHDVGPVNETGTPRLLFVGDMGYWPNEQAVAFFCERILPAIRERVPAVEFWIVGRNPSDDVQRWGRDLEGVMVVGAVESVSPYLERSTAVVVPILVGGGSRLKILEAMAAGRAVISTTVGAEGLEVRPGEDLLICDDPRKFADTAVALLLDGRLRRRLAASGKSLVLNRYDRVSACRIIRDDFRALLGTIAGRNLGPTARG